MRTVYTTQFQVAPDDAQEATFQALEEKVDEWVRYGVEKREGSLKTVPENDEVHPSDGVTVEGSFRGDPAETAMRTVEYRHPDDTEEGVEWHTIIKLAAHAGVVEFNLELRAGESSYRLTATELEPGPPYLVRETVEEFDCRIGGRTLTREPKVVDSDSIVEFVQDGLFSEQRRLPIVVVTAEEATGDPLVDPDQLAELLTGLAEVYVVEGDRTTYHLSDLLPDDFSTYNGAIRIYWAGIDRNDSPYRHPLFTRSQLHNWRREDKDPVWRISQRIYAASAELHQDGPVLETARSDLLSRFREQFKEAREKASTVPELDEQVDELLAELKQKEKVIEALQEDKKQLRRKFVEYKRTLDEQGAGEGEGEAVPRGPPDSVLDALHRAHDKHSDVLNVWSTAFDSAAESESDHAERVLETLEILADVSRDYFEARAKGEGLGANLEDVFRDRGAPKYAHSESETTMNQYGEDRTFREDGVEHTFQKHFTMGQGSKENCVQIYFEFDPEHEQTIIAHCGEHLPGEAWDS